MAENSKIEWTDHTFNPWIGCTKISPGCANCYADAQDRFRKWTPEGWGKGKPRKRTSEANWKGPLRWDREYHELNSTIELSDHRPRVFCASLSDWLDDEVPIEWLADLLVLIHATPHLDWLLLTKRPENWHRRIRLIVRRTRTGHDCAEWFADWFEGMPPGNVWVGTTVEDQTRADERIPELLKIPARVRFLSCEPLLGPVDLTQWLDLQTNSRQDRLPNGDFGPWYHTGYSRPDRGPLWAEMDEPLGIHWVICGGESGPGARAMHPDWARSLRDQCAAAGVAFHFKQWGEWAPAELSACFAQNYYKLDDHNFALRVGKKAAGRLLDGREWNEFPEGRR